MAAIDLESDSNGLPNCYLTVPTVPPSHSKFANERGIVSGVQPEQVALATFRPNQGGPHTGRDIAGDYDEVLSGPTLLAWNRGSDTVCVTIVSSPNLINAKAFAVEPVAELCRSTDAGLVVTCGVSTEGDLPVTDKRTAVTVGTALRLRTTFHRSG